MMHFKRLPAMLINESLGLCRPHPSTASSTSKTTFWVEGGKQYLFSTSPNGCWPMWLFAPRDSGSSFLLVSMKLKISISRVEVREHCGLRGTWGLERLEDSAPAEDSEQLRIAWHCFSRWAARQRHLATSEKPLDGCEPHATSREAVEEGLHRREDLKTYREPLCPQRCSAEFPVSLGSWIRKLPVWISKPLCSFSAEEPVGQCLFT